jgi:hypothetical protein
VGRRHHEAVRPASPKELTVTFAQDGDQMVGRVREKTAGLGDGY